MILNFILCCLDWVSRKQAQGSPTLRYFLAVAGLVRTGKPGPRTSSRRLYIFSVKPTTKHAPVHSSFSADSQKSINIKLTTIVNVNFCTSEATPKAEKLCDRILLTPSSSTFIMAVYRTQVFEKIQRASGQ